MNRKYIVTEEQLREVDMLGFEDGVPVLLKTHKYIPLRELPTKFKIIDESSTEEEKDLWNELGAFILRSEDFEFTDGRINELMSTYKISKR